MRIFYLLLLVVISASCERKDSLHDPSWMTSLPDTVSLCRLSIAGTHNSAADNGFPFVKCQKLSIREQLMIGIRAFDIRLRNVEGNLKCYHNVISVSSSWCDVRNEFSSFLQEYPGETLLLVVKQEGNPLRSTIPFDSLFYASIQSDTALFYLRDAIPALGDVRGKVVLLRRFATAITPLGSYLPVENDTFTFSPENPPLLVQDCYAGYHLFNRHQKWEAVRNLLPQYRNAFLLKSGLHPVSFQGYILNFANGTGYVPPSFISRYVNKRLSDHLATGADSVTIPGAAGIIFLDFAGVHSPELIERIIAGNRKSPR